MITAYQKFVEAIMGFDKTLPSAVLARAKHPTMNQRNKGKNQAKATPRM